MRGKSRWEVGSPCSWNPLQCPHSANHSKLIKIDTMPCISRKSLGFAWHKFTRAVPSNSPPRANSYNWDHPLLHLTKWLWSLMKFITTSFTRFPGFRSSCVARSGRSTLLMQHLKYTGSSFAMITGIFSYRSRHHVRNGVQLFLQPRECLGGQANYFHQPLRASTATRRIASATCVESRQVVLEM